jgi:hypothetical protein
MFIRAREKHFVVGFVVIVVVIVVTSFGISRS